MLVDWQLSTGDSSLRIGRPAQASGSCMAASLRALGPYLCLLGQSGAMFGQTLLAARGY